MKNFDIFSCDVLVIGGGGAGLRAAIEAKEAGADVLIVSKTRVGFGNNTYISKGSFAAATGESEPLDNPEVHVKDSVTGGRFINDQKLLTTMAREAGAQIAFLEKCGVNFYKEKGKIMFRQIPGHSYPRHVRGEHQAGTDFILPMRTYAKKIGVRFVDRIFITRLFTSNGRIAAATGIAPDGSLYAFISNCSIIATGGFAQVYLHTNNAAGMTGDGHALAFELGIPLKDMEFVQFYPTALGNLGTRILMYETLVFSTGAVLRNSKGENIIEKHGLIDPLAMTRDRLARAIMREILEGRAVEHGVIMDLSNIPEDKLASVSYLLPSSGLSGKKEFVVSPTVHFCMGGIVIDKNAETKVSGLFAAGEVCGGIHGANRLGGNALSEVFSMGSLAGKNAAIKAREIDRPEIPEIQITAEKKRLESLINEGDKDIKDLRNSIKKLMWLKAGIIRTEGELQKALEQIEGLKSSVPKLCIKNGKEAIKLLELKNMLVIAEMVCKAALLRTESRGAHYRNDYPEEDNDNWLKNIVIHKQDSKISLEAAPVSIDKV